MRRGWMLGLVVIAGTAAVASCGSFGTEPSESTVAERDAEADAPFIGIDAAPSTCPEACSGLGASCGDLDNGCGKTLSCGACEAAATCQAGDGGFACSTTPCVSNPQTC